MKELFASYFKGTISPEQEKELWSYINASKSNALSFNEADAQWRQNPQVSAQVRREFYQMKQRVASRRRRTIFSRTAVATFFAAACIAAVALIFPMGPFGHEKGVLRYAGSTMEQTLPDGTVVSLNKGTELSYDFSRKERLVRLDGEALFDVAHNPSSPFVLSGCKCMVSVLGTKFNVTDYSSDSNAQVILAEGSLKLCMNGSGEDILTPGDKVCFSGTDIIKTKVDVSEVDSWKSGAIIFDVITLNDFLNRVSREFGVNVVLQSQEYASSTFRASFRRGESLDNILQVICEIFPMQVRHDDNGYSLK